MIRTDEKTGGPMGGAYFPLLVYRGLPGRGCPHGESRPILYAPAGGETIRRSAP